jgi:ADP-ribosylglycohydrolase
MVSDDTEHTFMVGQSLLEAPDDALAFQQRLARRLRWWLVGLPAAVGFATLRSILKLWVGFSSTRSGVMSAGNGPAMRSAILGVYFADAPVCRHQFVCASTEITHRDVRAAIAAQAVAEVGAWMAKQEEDIEALWKSLTDLSELPTWRGLIAQLREALAKHSRVRHFARELGADGGVSGYALQSVPVAIYAALLHRDDFERALTEAIACGGDTDTVAAVVGALVGARLGTQRIPEVWRRGIAEWPRSLAVAGRIAERLDQQTSARSPLGPVRYFWPAIPLRNLLFLWVVLAHGLRRLLPPY